MAIKYCNECELWHNGCEFSNVEGSENVVVCGQFVEKSKFYLRIGDFMGSEDCWFETEQELRDFLGKMDTLGLSVLAMEVKQVLIDV